MHHRGGRASPHESASFHRCPGCDYDFLTGEGHRACNWYQCPYLPDDFDVFCPECNYNFWLGEGNPRCSDPPSCDHAKVGYEHAARAEALASDLSAPSR